MLRDKNDRRRNALPQLRGVRLADGTRVAPIHEVSPPGSAKPIDLVRIKRWVELAESGLEPHEAWAKVMIDPTIGFRAWRGLPSVPRRTSDAYLARMLCRVEPAAVARARQEASVVLASSSVTAARRVVGIMQGTTNPQADSVSLQAARLILQVVSAIPPAGSGSPSVAVSVSQVQAGAAPSIADRAAALESDPEALRIARELDDRLEEMLSRRVDGEVRDADP